MNGEWNFSIHTNVSFPIRFYELSADGFGSFHFFSMDPKHVQRWFHQFSGNPPITHLKGFSHLQTFFQNLFHSFLHSILLVLGGCPFL
jgi:hypothetical protein